MLTFLLAGAAAIAQTALPSDADIHCMAAYLVAAGNAKDDASISADDKAGIQAIVMYFFGKLDARKPGTDLKGDIMRLVESPSYATVLRPDLERCSAEASARAKYLQGFGQEAEAAAPKP